jgi:uncharacterized protein (DUF2252 family)
MEDLLPAPPAVNGAASADPHAATDGHAASHMSPELEPWQRDPQYDPRQWLEPWQRRREAGKKLRVRVSREAHGTWTPPGNRPDPVETLMAANVNRQQKYVPLRMTRMASSPFAFLRGSAAVMAWDLSRTPATGIHVVIDGDAHVSNFGFYGTAEQHVVFDLNDFDEVTFGPWEWDLKRLVASVNVAGRSRGWNKDQRRQAVLDAALGYRGNARRLQDIGIMDVWYRHTGTTIASDPDLLLKVLGIQPDPVGVAAFTKTISKVADRARLQTNAATLPKVAHRAIDGSWRFTEEPPITERIDDPTMQKIIASLAEYDGTLTNERGFMLRRYRVADVAHRVVGVGSVGTRCYVILLFGNGDHDPLFLQIKEATEPAAASLLPPLPFTHQGRRVVYGQHLMQALSDPMLGWTTIDGRAYYVRQLRNMKGSFPIEDVGYDAFRMYAVACGAVLARAHARTGDIAKIAGYMGNSIAFEDALADFAEAYGDQTELDHAKLVAAIRSGKCPGTVTEDTSAQAAGDALASSTRESVRG